MFRGEPQSYQKGLGGGQGLVLALHSFLKVGKMLNLIPLIMAAKTSLS